MPVEPAPAFRPPADDALAPRPEVESILTNYEAAQRGAPVRDRYGLHLALFLATVASTAMAGGAWGRAGLWTSTGWALLVDPVFLADGLRYATALLFFLTVHEFGHYLTARRYGIDVSLPYYVPLPLPPGTPVFNIGTFGAVIRIREPIRRTHHLFDVGAAGPLAGFVAALGVLAFALATLPGPEYVLTLGPGHEQLQAFVAATGAFPPGPLDPSPGGALALGPTLLFEAFRAGVPALPPGWEMYHYPVLFAGWLGLFFTALNLLPVGQLDGGHVTYALFGPRWHARIARATVWGLLFCGAIGAIGEVGVVAGVELEAAGRPYWIGPASAWALMALATGFLLSRTFTGRRAAFGAWAGLMVALAVAVWVGGVAEVVGWTGWLLWGFLLVLLVKVDHPPVVVEEPLTPGRVALGVLALVIFVLCFSPRPIFVMT